LQKALELDPLSLPINTYLALALFFVGRLDESEEQFLRSIDMDPSFFLPYVFYGMVILQQGRRGEAISNMQKVLERRPGSTKARAALVGAYAGLGERSEALKALDDLLRLSAKQYVPASDIALGYLSLGEREIALDWLHKGLDEKDMWMVWLRVDPRFDALRPEPRFVEILKSLGLRP